MSELIPSKQGFTGRTLMLAVLTGLIVFGGWALWREHDSTASAQLDPGSPEVASQAADSAGSGDANAATIRSSSTDDHALSGLSPFEQFVARSEFWQLPAHARVPGVQWTRLADSPEAWLASLPPEQRLQARAFIDRNGKALAFESREQQAWLLDNGFPALEEVAAFARLPEDQRSSCLKLDAPCSNGKLATLQADATLAEIERRIHELKAQSGSSDSPRQLMDMDPGLAEEIHGQLLQLEILLGRAVDAGSPLYAQHLRLRRDALIPSPIEEGQQLAASVATSLARYCGDLRLGPPSYAGNGSNYDAISATLRSVAGYSQQNLAAICGPRVRAVTPHILPKTGDSLVAKQH